ncbi:prepilin-type N-terminal cleavage/methylation domain-containing protein [Acidithiobacillus ferrooxidans]|uniref:PilW family protein n=1 Tax=Acidithiobacillus ferrooxidans TaxID=920 RepID=UPI00214BFE35|nr:prepilin-type N-terminal cleavage/methylation domain-containing protein [Acidithiobacillus ferrooxidans]MCR2829974.1 prepilin-type N-terminal cleavage/methylation domain-containing protein [Acidithiobacillus ferrooxidans]
MGNDKMPPSAGPVIAVAVDQGGLTLIELIVAIVLLGILSVGATALIVRSVQTYQTNRAAGELASQGEMALTVMTRGLHNAQPGTLNIRGGGASLSFTRCAAPVSAAAASACSGGYGFAFSNGQLTQSTPNWPSAQVLAVNASGAFSALPGGSSASTASGVSVTLTLRDPAADVRLSLSRAIAVLSSAYSVVNNQ